MIRCVQIGEEVMVMTWKEDAGRVTSMEMRVIPSILYEKIQKGFKYEEILRS